MIELKPGCVYVIDKFLKDEDLLNNLITCMNPFSCWKYKNVSTSETEKKTRFWMKAFYYKNGSEVDDHSEIVNVHLVNKIKEFLGVNNIEIIRIHANGQTYGQDGAWHPDDPYGAEEDIYTCLIYMTPQVKVRNVDEFNGHTQIKTNETILSIEPIFNRCVFFDSKMLHRGLCFDRNTVDLRITLNVLFKVLK
jgi:hypothetical protein